MFIPVFRMRKLRHRRRRLTRSNPAAGLTSHLLWLSWGHAEREAEELRATRDCPHDGLGWAGAETLWGPE